MNRSLDGLASLVVPDLAEAARVAAAWAEATTATIPAEIWHDMLTARISPAPTVSRPDRPVRGVPRQRFAIILRDGNRTSRKTLTPRSWPPDWTGFGPGQTFDDWSLALLALDAEGRIPVGAGRGGGGWDVGIAVRKYGGRLVLSWDLHPQGDSDHPVFPPTDDAWLASVLRRVVDAAPPDFAAATLEPSGTGFEAATDGGVPVTDATEFLRGYEWLTVISGPVVAKVGGIDALRASRAFWSVQPLAGGGAWLQATERADDYDTAHVTAVFEALRPALPDLPVRPSVINPNPWLLTDRTGLAPDPSPAPRPEEPTMSWDLMLQAVVADDPVGAAAAADQEDIAVELALPIPDAVHALVCGEDLAEDGGSEDPLASAAVFGGDGMADDRVTMKPSTVAAVHGWLARHEAVELSAAHAGAIAARMGGPASPEIAEHLEALYDELRDFYAEAAQRGAFVLKWPG